MPYYRVVAMERKVTYRAKRIFAPTMGQAITVAEGEDVQKWEVWDGKPSSKYTDICTNLIKQEED